MSSAGVRVGVGTRFRYDGETVEVIEMAITATGNEVVLKDLHGRVMRLAVKELLLSDRARVIPDSPGPSSDDDEDLASVVLAQLSHEQRDDVCRLYQDQPGGELYRSWIDCGSLGKVIAWSEAALP